MKKVLSFASGAKILILLVAGFAFFTASAQTEIKYDPSALLPFDGKILTGKLDNGLTYYIRRNDFPKDKITLRLVVDAGSVLEDDSQQGLAHFQEHLNFKGTEHFPDKKIIDTLEYIGIKFGNDLNAYTSFDQTVYLLPVPSDKARLGVEILRDWAGGVLDKDEAIESERGVILEEWRLGQSASRRAVEELYKMIFAGSKYADRLPIGKEEVLETFEPETLRRFYRDWYRPDLMAVVAVGDRDPEQMQGLIAEYFSDLKNPENAPERPDYKLPERTPSQAKVYIDKEIPSTSVQLIFRKKSSPAILQKDYRGMIVRSLVSVMLNARLSEIAQKPDAPFLSASAGFGSYSRDTDSFFLGASAANGVSKAAFDALVREIERVRRYGFTASELERAKSIYLNGMENAYNERDKSESDDYADEYQRHFLENEPVSGIEYEYALTRAILPLIDVQEENDFLEGYLGPDNRVVFIMGPEKEGISYPEKEELLAALDDMQRMEVSAYDDSQTARSLMDSIPSPGYVKKEKTYARSGVTHWTLSNGAQVFVKPTDFKNDEILFSAYSPGGRSLYKQADDMSLRYAVPVLRESGLSGISKTDLGKILAGKSAWVSPFISDYSEGMSGACSPRDSKEMFSQIYLYFTRPYFTEEAFRSVIGKEKEAYKNYLDDPDNYFNYQIRKTLSSDSPRVMYYPDQGSLDKVDYQRLQEIYKERFANAADFTFFFVGNIDLDSLRRYVETYIASLPAEKGREKYKDMKIERPFGGLERTVYKGEDQKSTVFMNFEKSLPYNPDRAFAAESFNEILSMRLFDALRSQMSGVYGVSSRLSTGRIPKDKATFTIRFGSNTQDYARLYQRALEEVDRLVKEGPTPTEMDALKQKARVKYNENLRENAYWLSSLMNGYVYGASPERIFDREKQIEKITPEKIRKAAGKAIDPATYIRFIRLPENMD